MYAGGGDADIKQDTRRRHVSEPGVIRENRKKHPAVQSFQKKGI